MKSLILDPFTAIRDQFGRIVTFLLMPSVGRMSSRTCHDVASGVTLVVFLAADSGGKSVGDALGIAMTVLMAIGFIWGTIKVIQGATQLNRGAEEGGMNIVGGVLIAAAPFIMNFVFGQLDLTGAASMPGSLE